MRECRACFSHEVSPIRGAGEFLLCRRCAFVQRRVPAAAAPLAENPFGRLPDARGLVLGLGGVSLLDRYADRGVPVLAIEPDPAEAARARRIGIPVVEAAFGPELAEALARGGKRAELLLAPCFGRLPEPHGAAAGIALALDTRGVAEIAFVAAADVLAVGAFQAAAREAHLPTLRGLAGMFEEEGLHLNDAARLGKFGRRVRLSTERRRSAALEALIGEEERLLGSATKPRREALAEARP